MTAGAERGEEKVKKKEGLRSFYSNNTGHLKSKQFIRGPTVPPCGGYFGFFFNSSLINCTNNKSAFVTNPLLRARRSSVIGTQLLSCGTGSSSELQTEIERKQIHQCTCFDK